MERNRLKRKLGANELCTISGTFESSDMIDFIGSLELFDAVWIDMEHSPVSWENLADFSRAADVWGMSSIVRVRANDPAIISLTLGEGVDGVIIPKVSTKEEAEQAVDAAKFGPIGRRGTSSGRRSYGRSDHFQRANDETILVVMIEDVAAVDRITEILEVPEIDLFYVGRHDLAQSLGLLGEPDHPKIQEVHDRAVRAIIAAGRVAAASTSPQDIAHHLEMGMRCITVPQWRSWLTSGAKAYMNGLQAAADEHGA